jgi:DNA-directed RNA polymerase subunit K/omega
MSKNQKKNDESDNMSEIIEDTELDNNDELYDEEESEDDNIYEEEQINVEKVEDENEDIEIINPLEDNGETVKWIMNSKENRITKNRLTKYEMVRILGERTLQLTMGAKPLVKNYEHLDYYKIAEEELKLNMTPIKIKRILPNKRYEIWTLDELLKDHLLAQLE